MITVHISMILNVDSIILGIGAWILACLAVAGKKVSISHRFSILSFIVCVISLVVRH